MTKSKVLIIGDVMLDINYNAICNKISNEYPIPVHLIKNVDYKIGGAGNVSLNLKNLITDIELLYVSGNDANSKKIESILNDFKIPNKNFIDACRTTTTKNRIFIEKKIVSRFDQESNESINFNIENEIINHIELNKHIIRYIVVSDYSKGIITDNILNYLRSLELFGINIFIDPKRTSANDYRDFFLLKPNLKEFNMLNKTNLEYNSIQEALLNYSKLYNNSNVVVTLNENGICGYLLNNFIYKSTKKDSVIDVTGAGDTCLSILVYCYYNDIPYETTLEMCNYFCQKAVKTVGNYIISSNDISEYNLSKLPKIVTSDTLQYLIDILHEMNKKIVFTNGCFDILHVGHITYLKKARELGDVLILGINTDESVKSNKNINRPFNSLHHRILMLQQYDFISYIIPFDEKTPYELLSIIKPHYLVKGGDYNVSDIIGREFAKETLTIPFCEGFSSTKYINLLENNNN